MKKEVKDFVEEYLAEVLEGNAAVFAGAGLSVAAGYVNWKELIRPLAREISLDIDLESDFVAVAQFHVNENARNRNRLHKAVIEAIPAKAKPTKNHELLAQLPIRTWWTTNYDKLIESALDSVGKVVDVKVAVSQFADTRPGRDAIIYKMHGDIDRPSEAVATKDDFERYLGDRGAFINALAGDLVSKMFLFLGFSFTDPNLEHVLTRVRMTFQENQRRHYAIFKRRVREKGELENTFEHHLRRQSLVVEDLKRFNVKVLLIDDYAEITEMLEELLNRYRRRTLFISGSAYDFEPWGETAVSAFAQKLGERLIASGTRIATGLGAGIGDAVFTGALREIIRSKGSVEDNLVLRPFPQAATPREREKLLKAYREEVLSHAGMALFLFGNKLDGEKLVNADGLRKEFKIALELGLPVLPIGATGSMAAELATEVLKDPGKLAPHLGDDVSRLKRLAEPVDDLSSLVDPIVELVSALQKGNSR